MLIKIAIKNPDNLTWLDYRDLQPFQGNLKELTEENYNKLKKSLEEFGYFVPLFAWLDNGVYRVLDGHGRLRLFKKEDAKFYQDKDEEQEATYNVPVLLIEAENEVEAKKKLLVISSQYQHVTQEGFDSFTLDLSDEWLFETVNFDFPIDMGEPLPDMNEPERTIYRIFIEADSEIDAEEIAAKMREIGLSPKISKP